MEYTKPRIVSVANAADAIQGTSKTNGTIDLADMGSPFPSVGAYASDE